MIAKTQLDSHPDVESLSAFAERALTKGELGQIAAHLAICGRCRQVVFLAQAAATEEDQLASSLTERTGKRQESRLKNWWFVWVPVASLATVVALAFSVHLRRAAVDEEMAKATQAASPLSGPRNEAVNSRPTETPLAAAPGIAARRAAAVRPEMMKSRAQVAPPPGPVEPMLPATALVNELELQPAAAAGWGEAMHATQTEERASAEQKDARVQQEMHGTMRTTAAATPAINVSAAPMTGFGAMANKTSTSALSFSPALLPSGLPAISTAKGPKVNVAVDKAGAVFVSTDAGGHWESVARQWSGQAVTVRMQVATPGVYELVNDQGRIWVGTDGRVWTAK